MISIKSQREIDLMREAGAIVARVHKRLLKEIKPGITTLQINKICEEVIKENGATASFKGLYDFPCAVCTSVNEVLVHGIPNNKKLKEGDIISVDVGACFKGYHGDSAWSYAVGKISKEASDLLKVTEEALYEGLKQVKPGNRVGDISNAIQTYIESRGYYTPKEYTGHGVGKSVHEDPYVPNVGKKGEGPVLKKGMCLAIEPMVFTGTAKCKTLDDDWGVVAIDNSLAAHYEHTIVVTDEGYEILTKED